MTMNRNLEDETRVDSKNDSRERILNRLESLGELPLTVLSLALIPLLIGPFLFELDSRTERVYTILESTLWAIFIVDITSKILISTNRFEYIKTHWIEVLLAVIPWFRILRVIRVLVILARYSQGVRRLAQLDTLIILSLTLVICAATALALIETGKASAVQNYHGALWWAAVTMTTVEYADPVPITIGGRVISLVLMLGGLTLFGAVTANIAALLLKSDNPDREMVAVLLEEVRELRRELKGEESDS